jgi:NTP pyrophosphatase (non-canonical NTP hydrolase)
MNFLASWREVSRDVFETSHRNGFWETERNVGEAIALIHSELSEALEAYRHGNPPDDKVPDFNGLTAELADAVIRIMDLGYGLELPLAQAILAKAEYNKGRPYKHGKEF